MTTITTINVQYFPNGSETISFLSEYGENVKDENVPQSKIISSSVFHRGDEEVLLAVCSDGSVWEMMYGEWSKIVKHFDPATGYYEEE